MSLPSGSRVGAYEIVEPIGRGGMGEVYRARDPRLKRDVALKVLGDGLADKPDFADRFQQEAQAAAALNHPHIVAVYDVGVGPGPLHVVSELLEGRTLRAVLDAGPIPMRQAIEWAGQLAEGLAAAHAHGIVHRDIKPENVFVTQAGTIKILDFGLAKVRERSNAPAALTQATRSETAPGVLLGTLGYMAPEQVRGGAVDHRADIFSFGAVVYEMLAGRRAFDGPTPADTLSAILSGEPADLPPGSHTALEFILRRCMEKEPGRRFASVGDAGLAIRALATSSSAVAGATVSDPRPRRRTPALAAAAAAVIAVAGVTYAAWILWPSAESAPPFRFTIAPPPGTTLGIAAYPSFAIWPDGRRLAFIVRRGTRDMLAIRSLDAFDSVVVDNSEDAWAPLWSPDSRQVGFFAGTQLKRVAASGGRPETITDFGGTGTVDERAGTWSADGTIVFAGADRMLMKVSSNGGRFAPAMPASPADDGAQQVYPSFLPDGRRFLFSVLSAQRELESALYVGSLDGGTPQIVRDRSSRALFVEPGVLLSVSQGTLFAEPFDLRRLTVSSPATPVARDIVSSAGLRAPFSASNTGVVVYRTAQPTGQMVWVSRGGAIGGRVGEPGDYSNPRLSPDEQSVATELHSTDPSGRVDGNLWVGNLARGLFTKLTFDTSGHAGTPVWSPDGKSIAYRNTGRMMTVSSTPAASEPATLVANGPNIQPSDWSADGRTLIYVVNDPKTSFDIWMMSADGGSAPVPFARSPFMEREARLSADGRWLAYTSNESGLEEVYVRPFPSGPGKWRISTSGGRGPRWRADGTELFFFAADGKVMAVPVRTTNGFEADAAQALFDARIRDGNNAIDYEVTRDGQRFLINEALDVGGVFNVISTWRAAQQP